MRDYTRNQLGNIFNKNLRDQNYRVTAQTREHILDSLMKEKEMLTEKHFGNARNVVSIVQDLPNQISLRLAKKYGDDFSQVPDDELRLITLDDVRKTCKRRIEGRQTNKEKGIFGFQPGG